VETARNGIAGPVHVNIPLSEPLVPKTYPEPADRPAENQPRHPENQPMDIPDLAEELADKRVLIVAGGSCDTTFPDLLGDYADALSSPVISDPQCKPRHATTIASGDMLARTGHLDLLRPDVVLRFGGLPTSKSVWTWLENSGVRQILVGRSRLADPLGSANVVLDVPQTGFVAQRPSFSTDASYLRQWQEADRVVTAAIDAAVAAPVPTEPAVARAVTEFVPPNSALFVGSSMPIRDVDTYGVPRADVRVVANRGVNGIDGSISTAFGMAMAGVPTTALIGDVSALHDATALSEVARLDAPLRIIVVNNDGGGIFSFLPQRRSSVIADEMYEKHWGTPHGLSLVAVARSMGLEATDIDNMADLEEVAGSPIQPELIEVTTDRDENVEVHRAIIAAVREALAVR
jgi:2-succinyl-5-enolpyruvyl-6-hydroxy-3-cyclohexene-1-carboxylate synthase